ncbi:MAG TPA: hypothetical protein VF712_00675 [Thermoleophilaceae bacterium]
MKRLALVALLLAAVPATPSQAATVGMNGTTLSYVSTPGEANHPIFHHRAEDELVVYDSRVNEQSVTAGPGCAQDGESTVICPRAGVARAEFLLGERGPLDFTPDSLTLTADVPVPVEVSAAVGSLARVSYIDLRPIEATLDGVANDGPAGRGDQIGPGVDGVSGGDGADRIRGNDRPNFLDGDNGGDDVDAGAGADTLTLASYNDVGVDAVGLETRGADRGVCGPGTDTVYYDRSDTVEGCERQVLVTDQGFEYEGGPGADRIVADRGPATVHGRAGNDRLGAQRFVGGVVLFGDAGSDRLAGNTAEDTLDGGSGNDLIYGAEGDDFVTGGSGRDRISAGRGGDSVRARDGFTDTVACGSGRDTVTADRRDRVARDCERVSRR